MSAEIRLRCRLATAALLAGVVGAGPARAADSATDLLNRGETALAVGDVATATSLFRKARKIDPGVASEADWGLARVALARGELKQALQIADRLSREPARAERRAALAMLRGLVLSRSASEEDLDAAEAAFLAAAETTPSSPAPLYDLGVLQITRGRKDEGLATLLRCRALAPDSDLARRAERIVRHPSAAGRKLAAEFSFTTLSGEALALADLEGRVVVLDFWATWCPPCVASVDELKALRRRWPAERLAIVSISADTNDAAWRAFVAKNGMTWPQYRDADARVARAFSVHAFPTYVLVDPEGVEIRRLEGLDPRHSVLYRLRDTLEEILGKP
jgi:thioredoxin-like negative regulator of GroEL